MPKYLKHTWLQRAINDGDVTYYLEPIPCGMYEKLVIDKKMVISDDAAYIDEMRQGNESGVIFIRSNWKTMNPVKAVVYFDAVANDIINQPFLDMTREWAEKGCKVFIRTSQELGEGFKRFDITVDNEYLYQAMNEYDLVMHKLTLIKKNDILKIDKKEIIPVRTNKAAEIIEDLLEEQRMNKMELSFRMGEDIRLFSQRMCKTKDFKFTKFIEMIETLGYTFMIEPTGIYRVSKTCMDAIYERKAPDGFYFTQGGDDEPVTAVVVKMGEITSESFVDKTDALEWLKQHQK